MNTKKFDRDDNGVKVRGAAQIKVFRDGSQERDFISRTVYMFTDALRIDGDEPELVRLLYPNAPQDGDYEWSSPAGFSVFYTDPTGVQYSTREGRITLKVSENSLKQDGSFDVVFDTKPQLRVTGLFNAYAE
ncbi:hypothetical protein PUN49_28060 [Pseudomonas extremaustralis]|uniref:hypothetical protein n=1 Tax=Pseudomonas extremaustralis TaxID=359110 RepID=UPI0021C6135C|nr:hypothetical protein [Pseudomonas extremaustralis]MDB1108173.1 hypothetical protein [Pseudomonas extremaustralis]MDG2970859.1 hypothetical protein [Pseudomonas extremaustralis]UUJ38499.1 hypothetical protein L1A22_17305 [Pseudomonas extremaustralis]